MGALRGEGVTRSSPSRVSTAAGRKRSRGPAPGSGAARVPARAPPHQESSIPSRRRRAGRTKSQKLTITEAGLPGRPKTSPPGVDREDQRLARLDGHGVEDRLAAELGQHSLDEVELPHGDAAAEEQHVGAQAALGRGRAGRPPGRARCPAARSGAPGWRPRPAGSRCGSRGAARAPGVVSGGTTSSPVVSTATVGARWTGTSRSRGWRGGRAPPGSGASPPAAADRRRAGSPRGGGCARPARAAVWKITRSRPPSVSSTGTTRSAPRARARPS